MKSPRNLGGGLSAPANAETEYRNWLRLGQPGRLPAAGITGAVLLLLGSFAPMANVPPAGTISFTGLGHGQGPFLLFAGVASLIHLRTWRRGNFGLTLVVVAFLAWKAVSLPHLSKDVEPGWGWAPLVLGTALLILSGWPRQQAQKIPPSI